jgi:hypothetical protein
LKKIILESINITENPFARLVANTVVQISSSRGGKGVSQKGGLTEIKRIVIRENYEQSYAKTNLKF